MRAQVWLMPRLKLPTPASPSGCGVSRSTLSPSPSWPAALLPQQYSTAVVSKVTFAHACELPVAMADALLIPVACTGTALSTVDPRPRLSPLPQHHTVPSLRTAQVNEFPALMSTASVIPLTGDANKLFVVVPLPSWPNKLAPQQCTAPLSTSAQAWSAPADTLVYVGAAIATGTELSVSAVMASHVA